MLQIYLVTCSYIVSHDALVTAAAYFHAPKSANQANPILLGHIGYLDMPRPQPASQDYANIYMGRAARSAAGGSSRWRRCSGGCMMAA